MAPGAAIGGAERHVWSNRRLIRDFPTAISELHKPKLDTTFAMVRPG